MLVDTVVSRGEFLTSYTPYQAEISQGTLTTIFEFQTMICQLTGMDVANASMYDGSTAVPEAAMMAVRVTGRDRVLVARPCIRNIAKCCARTAQHQGMPVDEFGYVDGNRRASIWKISNRSWTTITPPSSCRSPNFFGIVEEVKAAAEIAHKHGALLVVVFTEAVSLGLLEPPPEADIVAGELQTFAISPSYGGPYAGIIATKEKFMRQMPGRLVGRDDGLARQPRILPDALHARAAHPPREGDFEHLHQPGADRADGDRLHDRVRQGRAARTGRAEPREGALPRRQDCSLRFTGTFFNEFVRRDANPDALNDDLLKQKIIGGLPLGRFYPELDGLHAGLRHGDDQARRHGSVHEVRGAGLPSRPGIAERRRLADDQKDSSAHHAERASALRDQLARARRAISFPSSMSPPWIRHRRLGCENVRDEIEGFPEVSEVEVIRHFTRLSTWNYAIDLGMYPLGSCTMKYNPRINETGGAHRRPRLGASLSARRAVAGLHGNHGAASKTRSPRSPAWTP